MEHMVGRLATKFIENMLEQARQKITTDGYENWKFDLYQKEFAVPDLFQCHFTIKDLQITGASKFVAKNVNYDLTTSRATFDIFIPKLCLGIGDVAAGVTLNAFGMNFEAQVKGWIKLLEPRVNGSVVLEINDEGKVIATGADVTIELKKIQSKIILNAMDTDFSDMVNNFLRAKLPEIVKNYVNQYKIVIEEGLMAIANQVLAQMF